MTTAEPLPSTMSQAGAGAHTSGVTAVDPATLNKLQKRLGHALTELFTTEWEYVGNMHTLVSVYVDVLTPVPAPAAANASPSASPMLVRGKNAYHRPASLSSSSAVSASSSVPQPRTRNAQQLLQSCGFAPEPLSAAESRALFRDIESLIAFNEAMLNDLDERLQTHDDKDRYRVRVGDILVQFAPHLKMYRHYFTAQDASDRLLTSLEASRPNFKRYLQWASGLPQCKNLNLQAFLIRPVQRIPQLSLLVQEVIACNQALREAVVGALPLGSPEREAAAAGFDAELDRCKVRACMSALLQRALVGGWVGG